MKRRLINVLAVVSMLLCLATVGSWIVSYIGQGGDWKLFPHSGRF